MSLRHPVNVWSVRKRAPHSFGVIRALRPHVRLLYYQMCVYRPERIGAKKMTCHTLCPRGLDVWVGGCIGGWVCVCLCVYVLDDLPYALA